MLQSDLNLNEKNFQKVVKKSQQKNAKVLSIKGLRINNMQNQIGSSGPSRKETQKFVQKQDSQLGKFITSKNIQSSPQQLQNQFQHEKKSHSSFRSDSRQKNQVKARPQVSFINFGMHIVSPHESPKIRQFKRFFNIDQKRDQNLHMTTNSFRVDKKIKQPSIIFQTTQAIENLSFDGKNHIIDPLQKHEFLKKRFSSIEGCIENGQRNGNFTNSVQPRQLKTVSLANQLSKSQQRQKQLQILQDIINQPNNPVHSAFYEFIQDQIGFDKKKRNQDEKLNDTLVDFIVQEPLSPIILEEGKKISDQGSSPQKLDFWTLLNKEVLPQPPKSQHNNSGKKVKELGAEQLPDLNSTTNSIFLKSFKPSNISPKTLTVEANNRIDILKKRQNSFMEGDITQRYDQKFINQNAFQILQPGARLQARLNSCNTSRQNHQINEQMKELEIMRQFLTKEFGSIKISATQQNQEGLKNDEYDIAVTGTNILQGQQKNQVQIIQAIQKKYNLNKNVSLMDPRKQLDILELKKSYEFRQKQTKDLESGEQPEVEPDQMPVMVLALVSRKTASPINSNERKKKLEPINYLKSYKMQNFTPKLALKQTARNCNSSVRKEVSLPDEFNVPWLELVKMPSLSIPKLEKAIQDAKEVKPGFPFPDPVLDMREHLINQVIRKSNEFIYETFLKPNDVKIDVKKVQAICAFFQIPIHQKLINEPQKLKNKEFQIVAKERILIILYETLNKENGLLHPDFVSDPLPTLAQLVGVGPTNFYTNTQQQQINDASQQQFPVNPFRHNERRYFIGYGNNHGLVRTVFKQRWWWSPSDPKEFPTFESNNFIWTQWRRDPLVEELPTLKDAHNRLREVKLKQSDTNQKLKQKLLKDLKIEKQTLQEQKLQLIQKIKEDQEAVLLVAAEEKKEKEKKVSKKNSRKKSQKKHKEKPKPEPLESQIIKKNSLLMKTIEKQIREVETKIKDQKDKDLKDKDKISKADRLHLYAKMEHNYHLSNKKALFWNMCQYYKTLGKDPFEHLPLTFHIEHGLADKEFINFKQYFNNLKKQIAIQKNELKILLESNKSKRNTKQQASGNEAEEIDNLDDDALQQRYGVRIPRNIWITKPGENSNRGSGITVCDTMQEIIKEVEESAKQGHTHIIQKYIDRPLLFQGRKFDIRAYGMLTSINTTLKGYFYEDGYLRTSSKEFTLQNLKSKFIHLTNDAVQCHSDQYGKFENGNKLSYSQFQKFLEHTYPERNISVENDIIQQIKRLITEAFIATFTKIDANRRQHSFEIFGFDFMIDEKFKVILIECNTNPCLELCSPLSARIIPALLDNAFRIAVDPIFPPPDFSMARKNVMHEILPINKMELVFDERIQGSELRELFKDVPRLALRIQDDEGEKDEDIEGSECEQFV